MPDVKAVKALRYAFSREILKLFAVIVLGWLMIVTGFYLASDPWRFRSVLYRVLEPLLYLGGILVFYGGLVALVYKIFKDSQRGL